MSTEKWVQSGCLNTGTQCQGAASIPDGDISGSESKNLIRQPPGWEHHKKGNGETAFGKRVATKRCHVQRKICTNRDIQGTVKGRVWLRKLGLDGDGHGDLSVHGGIDKAVYAYPVEHYEYWARELGRDKLPFGQFGENLTVEGVLEEEVHIGDVFQVAGARVQVTQPRVPCFKLGVKMGCVDISEAVFVQ